ncbi:MAG: hypothetical protein ACI84K_001263 [Pseudohongiellaceae bacterium]|jgi:hypothetical protein
MILQKIDKPTYRKHLNKVIGATIASMLLITLGVSTALIHLVGNPDKSNFMLNLVGVLVAASIVGTVLYRARLRPFMTEVLYVWRLKQELNAIYRQSAKLKPAEQKNDPNALIITYFNLKASIQLYELDDNDLTLRDLRKDLLELESKLQGLGRVASPNDYHRGLLKQLSASKIL